MPAVFGCVLPVPMATAPSGVSKIQKAEKGITFLHAGGMTLLPTSSPAYNAMFDMIDIAELSLAEKIERARLVKAMKEPPPEVQKPFADGLRRMFRPAAPGAVKVKYAPAPIPGQITLPEEMPRRPIPPSLEQYRDSALARRLGLVRQETNVGNPMLFLHEWELVKGKDGTFARGTIAGHPHFPDGSVVDTPYLSSYDRETNVFRSQDGTVMSLGAVRPGTEKRQSVLLEEVKQALSEKEPAKMLERDEIPALTGLSVVGNKVAMKFANNQTMKVPLTEPVGLVFTRAAKLIVENHGVSWGDDFKLPAKPSPAPAQATPAPSPSPSKSAPAPSPAKPGPDKPELPPVALPADPDFEELNRRMAGDSPAADPSDLEASIEQPELEIQRGKILAAIPPKQGGSMMYEYDVDCGKGAIRVSAGKEFDNDLITLDACRQLKHVLIRGDQIVALGNIDGTEVELEKAADLARPFHAQKKRPVIEHSGDAPAFMSFKPSDPEPDAGGPSLA